MISKSELGWSSLGAESDHRQDREPQAASHSESAETKKETSPVLGVMLVGQAVEARNNLHNANGPEERQLIFATNSQYWLRMKGAFDQNKKKRQEEEMAGGVVDIDLKDAFLADSLDNIAIGFCEEAAALWEGQAIGDAEAGNYSLNYYYEAKEADCGGGDDPSEHGQSIPWARVAGRFTANQYAQDYLHGNPEIGPDSIWGDFLPRPGQSGLRDSHQELSDKLQANDRLRAAFRLLHLQLKTPSPECWKSFRGFTRGLLKSLSDAYEQARDCYGERIREEDQEIEPAIIGRVALVSLRQLKPKKDKEAAKMSSPQNNPIFGVLCLPALTLDLGRPSLVDLWRSCRLDGSIANLAIEIKGFGRKLGRKFIRFLKSEGPLQGDS